MATLLFTFLFVVLAACAIAAPISEEKRGGIGSDLLGTFNLMEQYAGASYCSNNYQSAGDKVTCPSKTCPLVEAANTTSLIEYQIITSTDVTGYVAVDHTNSLVVVAFRGSSSVKNWFTNLDFKLTNTDLCDGCTAHNGFWQSWVDSRDDILGAIKNYKTAYPGYKLVSTGHSLGGAIATLSAAQLRHDGYDVALYTFGAPRIAGTKLSSYITNQPGGNYRVTHWNDPVPNLPPIAMGFVHVSPEYYINKPNLQTVGASDIKTYSGSINLGGNTRWVVTDVGAHLWYFNSIAQCAVNSIIG
ncbi:alpha/beta-hydrolase [Lophiostoma macrostomum CBS 122681]|uniref:Alpha/beta-hydrolase n=1 Tax=Lophiostoma macrostomum CBS 122681 TaxID=1314788 RepID=A0A6A6T1H2_9PLEO|nr:alpha/beta-hydrolase [Lophiostoma macrostomum CBS 122681]